MAASPDSAAAAPEQPCYCSLLNFLLTVGRLKKLKRTGWVLSEVRDPETVAEHSFRAGICAFLIGADPQSAKLIQEKKLDRNKCIKMALVHDLAEALAGDITPHCGVSAEEKRKREREALQAILRPLPFAGVSSLLSCDVCRKPEQEVAAEAASPLLAVGEEIRSLWEDYEAGTSEEAKFVFDIDKFEMVLQAFEYESDPTQEGPASGPFYYRAQEEEEGPREEAKETDERKADKPQTTRSGDRKKRRLLMPTFYRSTLNVFRTDLFKALDRVLRKRRDTLPQVQRAALLEKENGGQ
ncbi:hypothetical protein BESB_070530 [Besnoitia besnoiti]|uniref:5'-deoxynucleotidase n=1 Tax=Besnoitia besnoiti TaxID=94643 RepID=A0A2A9MC56_BESBE|nr:uncharacterized protein BESB_070530 [Besnoitia besnoiti]PFH33901.1 hypothetical protein BESB_070530 [Besnoitia besnoiti]